MAIDAVTSVIVPGTTTTPGAIALPIDVPEGAQVAVFFWRAALSNGLASLMGDFFGEPTIVQYTAIAPDGGVAWAPVTNTGPGLTFTPVYVNTRQEDGTPFAVVFLSDVGAVRDADARASASATAVSIDIDSAVTDTVLGFDSNYNGAPLNPVAGWTTLLVGPGSDFDRFFVLRVADSPGAVTTTVSASNPGYPLIAGISFAVASSVPETVLLTFVSPAGQVYGVSVIPGSVSVGLPFVETDGSVYPILVSHGVVQVGLPFVDSQGSTYPIEVQIGEPDRVSISLPTVSSQGVVYPIETIPGSVTLDLVFVSSQGVVYGLRVVDAQVQRFVFTLRSSEAVDRVVLETRIAVDSISLGEGSVADYPRAGIRGLRLVIPFTRTWTEPILSARVRLVRPDGVIQEYAGATVVDETIEVDPVSDEDTTQEGSYQVQGFLRVSPEKEIPLSVQRFVLLRSI